MSSVDETAAVAHGHVAWTMFGPDGAVKASGETHNLITSAGDNVYVARGSGVASPPAAPTGMKLGTGTATPTKTGSAAALTSYLSGSNKAFDSSGGLAVSGNVATYKRTYAAGEATTASAITEVALVNDTIATDGTSAVANTISRALLTGVPSKGAADVLAVTWTHTVTGA